MFWKPPLSHKVFNTLLLGKVHLEDVTAGFLERLYVAAVANVSPHLLELEKPTSGESHNGEGEEINVNESEQVYATLNFYIASQMPRTLAVVRYTADLSDTGPGVYERHYADTCDSREALQEDVTEALSFGINTAVLSHYPPECFPAISQFLHY